MLQYEWDKTFEAYLYVGLSMKDSSGRLNVRLTEQWLPLGRRPGKTGGRHLLFIWNFLHYLNFLAMLTYYGLKSCFIFMQELRFRKISIG